MDTFTITKKMNDAAEAYGQLASANRKYRNHLQIARNPLPKKKQPLHDGLVTQTLVARRNAQARFDEAYGKMSMTERAVFVQYGRMNGSDLFTLAIPTAA